MMAMAVMAFSVALATAALVTAAQTPAKRTTMDKVYTKDQAAKGEAQYLKVCASCHDPAKVPAGKKPAPALVGDKFFDKWTDKSLAELITLIATTMPDDASAVLTDDEAADQVAYILKMNNFPDGPARLPSGEGAKNIIIVKPGGGEAALARSSRRP
jgi:mono/diheme cytochrome c family protein